VVVPVADVDRAKHFCGDQVGFVVDLDHQISDTVRVIQLTPPGSGCSITIGTGVAKMEPGSLHGLQLVVADLAAARAQLAERGVEVSPVQHFGHGELADGPDGRWNSVLFFSDPDCNSWAVQERPAA
jgi:hypothetical protein